jgi:homoserine acetyltransferase
LYRVHHHNLDFYFSKLNGPEPEYHNIVSGYKTFTSPKPFPLKYNSAVLPEVTIVYETWGKLNENKDNVVLIHAGLSASSHAKSHEVFLLQFLAGTPKIIILVAHQKFFGPNN